MFFKILHEYYEDFQLRGTVSSIDGRIFFFAEDVAAITGTRYSNPPIIKDILDLELRHSILTIPVLDSFEASTLLRLQMMNGRGGGDEEEESAVFCKIARSIIESPRFTPVSRLMMTAAGEAAIGPEHLGYRKFVPVMITGDSCISSSSSSSLREDYVVDDNLENFLKDFQKACLSFYDLEKKIVTVLHELQL